MSVRMLHRQTDTDNIAYTPLYILAYNLTEHLSPPSSTINCTFQLPPLLGLSDPSSLNQLNEINMTLFEQSIEYCNIVLKINMKNETETIIQRVH